MLTNRPKTKIIVDGGDPDETRRIKDLLGFVDGQTGKPLKAIPYEVLDLNRQWESFDIAHELTTKGVIVLLFISFPALPAPA
jgi:hypothetical protein